MIAWAIVVVVVTAWAYRLEKVSDKQRQVARLCAAAAAARRDADRLTGEADRLAGEAKIARAAAQRARQRIAARAAFQEFMNPN
jgi:hypothetical protein